MNDIDESTVPLDFGDFLRVLNAAAKGSPLQQLQAVMEVFDHWSDLRKILVAEACQDHAAVAVARAVDLSETRISHLRKSGNDLLRLKRALSRRE